MKTIRICISSLILLCLYQPGKAQTLNWTALGDSKHIINAGAGWDYSLSYSAGYAYQLKTKMPLVLNANFSIPPGEKTFDDFKTRLGGQLLLLDKTNLKGSVALNGIYRRYENPLATLRNFGSEMKGSFGYYKSKWFVAGEIGFDKAIATHFEHSESFKENIFQDVKDGWSEPATGGNFLYGVQTGYSFLKYDVTFSIGNVITQDFTATPLIPYYLMLGLNYKIGLAP